MIRESFTAADAGTRKSLLASEGDAYDTLTMRVSLYFSHAEEDTDQIVFEGRQRTFLGQFQTRDKSMLLKIFSQVIFFFSLVIIAASGTENPRKKIVTFAVKCIIQGDTPQIRFFLLLVFYKLKKIKRSKTL